MSWRETLLELRAQGFDVLDWLSAVEQDGSVRITACLLSSADPDLVQLVSDAGAGGLGFRPLSQRRLARAGDRRDVRGRV